MKEFIQRDILNLFSNLCCSKCKNDFDFDSIKIIENYNNLFICNLHCCKCGKDFGDIILNFCKNSKKHTPLEVVDGPLPISKDDVINAHKFIQKNL